MANTGDLNYILISHTDACDLSSFVHNVQYWSETRYNANAFISGDEHVYRQRRTRLSPAMMLLVSCHCAICDASEFSATEQVFMHASHFAVYCQGSTTMP